MEDLQDKIIELMDLFDDEQVTTADKIDRPQRALDREAFDDFMKRNPMAAGGMLAQPSADGSRPGYATSTVKTKKFKYPITNQFGTFYSDKAPPKVKSKYDNLTPEMKDFYKKTTGKTWNKKDWDSGNYQRQNLSRKGKQSKVVKESKMSPFYKKIGFFKQFENNVRVEGERLKLNKKGYITFEQLNNLLGRKDTESAIDDLKRVLVGDRPSPWLEKKEGVAKWKKSKNLVIQRGDSMGTNYIKYPDKKTLKSMKQYYKNQEFINIAKRDVLRKPSIEGMKVFYEDEDLMNAIRKWSGNPNDKEALKIINSVFGSEELAGPNAIKNLGRALIGEIKVEGIKQDKVLGKKILEGVTRTANGQAGRSAWDQAAYMYAKDRMNLLFERGIGDKSFQQFFDEIDGVLRETLGKNRAKFHIDEVFSLRTGLTNNNQVYSVFSQILDKNLNSKIKQNYDATFSKNLINVRKELAKNNPDFNEVKRITDLQNVKYKEYSSKYPNAKFSTFGEFDIEKNRFKSPEEVFGIERFNQLPSDIQKKIKQDYRKNRISIDVGGAQTQKELLTSLEKNIKPGSTLNKTQFENMLASFGDGTCAVQFGPKKRDGGRIGYQVGTIDKKRCIDQGIKNFNEGKFKTADQVKDAAKLLRGGRAVLSGLMKYGIVPELAFVGLEATGRSILGEKPLNAIKKSIDTFTFGLTDFTSGIEAEKFGKDADRKLAVDKFRASQNKVNSIEQQIANLETLNTGSQFGYEGDQTEAIQMKKVELEAAKKELEQNYVNPDIVQYIDRKTENIADAQMAKSAYAKASLKDQMEGIPGVADYMDTETARVFPKQPSQIELNLNMLPSFQDYQKSDQGQIDRTILNAPDEVLQEISPDALDLKKALQEEYKMENLKNTFGAEQIYGTQGVFSQPLAGGGIAGLSGGKKSGPPPISGPTPDGDEGLPAAFKNVRKR